ncbi:MAG: NUDIX domain-containing protein [Planctomycetota bacterium]
MKTDYSCGVVPFRRVNGRVEFLLVQHKAGHWSFPKGHPEAEEDALQTARRELAEETGLSPLQVLSNPSFSESYEFTKRSGKQVLKRVTYFLGEVAADAAVRVQEKEIGDYQWADAETTRARITFIEGKTLFDQVYAYFNKHLRHAA